MSRPAPAAPAPAGRRDAGRRAVIAIPYLWLLAFFLLPFLILLKISVSEMDGARIGDVFRLVDGSWRLMPRLDTYRFIAHDDLYLGTYLASLGYAAVTAAFCLLLGYPFAYFMAGARARVRPALLMLVMLPFWTAFLLRVYAWKGLLSEGGWVAEALTACGADRLLLAAGLIPGPANYLASPFSLVIGMTYTYLPFMVLPLYSTLSKMDLRLIEAANDLGASAWVAFWRITVPLSRAGIIAGTMLVFIPCIGEFVIPGLLGGPQTQMIGRTLWDEFFSNNDWPMASAAAVAMILLIIVPLAVFNKYQAEAAERR